ncbi:unnamed protein product [Peniophora sp. CBMAI 1063]|nr:unnamed protein product [Peniophora sp. CBMAI 1063]
MIVRQMALLVTAFVAAAATQDLSVPSSWQNTTSNLPCSERQNLAHDAAATLVSHIAPGQGFVEGLKGYQTIGSQFAVLAQQDWLSGNRTWENTVTSNMQVFTQKLGVSGNNPKRWSNVAYWSLVYIYAYQAYGQDSLLKSALSLWTDIYNSVFISDAAVASGANASTAGRNVSYPPPTGCTDSTIVGGVFFTDVANNTVINGETVGAFMAASAYLYEATQNTTYRDVAQLSLDFMTHHLWNGTIVYDSFDPRTCKTSDTTTFVTFNQAWFIEGLSVMANETKNDTLVNLLHTAVPSTATFPAWTLQSGVISEGSAVDDPRADLKAWFVRGLAEAWRRNPGTELAKYIESYITVQYNSIFSNSRAEGTSFYVPSWFGPSNTSFHALGSIAALDVLNAAFSFVERDSTGRDGNSTTPDTRDSSGGGDDDNSVKSWHAGAIVGGIVGAVTALLIVGFGFWLHRRRARRRSSAKMSQEKLQEAGNGRGDGIVIEPFLGGHEHSESGSDQPYTPTDPFARAHANSSGTVMPVTVGQQSKSDRYNLSVPQLASSPVSITGARSLPVASSPSGSGGETTLSSSRPPQSESEDIPGLVQRLNSLLQASGHGPIIAPVGETGTYDEAPPQYEREVRSNSEP